MSKLEFSDDQRQALETIKGWLKSPDPILTLGGYAGSGKSTVIQEVVRSLAPSAAVVAPTGKAVSVLKRKGLRDATTLHGLIYLVTGENEEGDPIFIRREHLDVRDDYGEVLIRGPELVIVDEASMINEFMHRDLELLAPKILYVGDHGQLEPIGYDPGLMKDPDIRLEQIHRQAKGSAIILYGHHLRQAKDPFDWEPTDEVTIANRWPDDIHEYDVVLVGRNGTRHYVNKVVREAKGFEGDLPQVGETLICLQNHRDFGIFNGLQIVVENIRQLNEHSAYVYWTDFDGLKRHTRIWLPQLGTSERYHREESIREGYGLFDWGYVLTVHKSQGSEFERVCVIESIHQGWNEARWRYTAATRASKQLTYVVEKRKLSGRTIGR